MGNHSAHEVAAEVRKRLPGVPVKKLHKLLYYCQGYHLATFGEPLFRETISAWDMGPVVGQLWWTEGQGFTPTNEAERLSEGELNTIGYVISRYGRLSGRDLEHLTHSENPWLEADRLRQERQVSRQRITHEALIEFFGADADSDETSEPPLDVQEIKALIRGAHDRLSEPLTTDSPQAISARMPA